MLIAASYEPVQTQQLRYVVAVADERHFTRAATRLHVAQPSLSAQVRALERELGAPLFERGRGTIALTAAGEAFLPWARQALADMEAGRAEIRELLGLRGGRLALGATPSLTTSLLPTLLAEYRRRYPQVGLVLREAGSGDLAGRLADGALDLALVILPVPVAQAATVSTVALAEEELVLAVPADHPLGGRRTLRIESLRGVPLVLFRAGYHLREATFTACRAAGFEPTLAVEGGEMDGVLALAAAGLGAAIVPTTAVAAADGRLRAIRFTGTALTRTVGLAERADRPRSPASAAFAEMLTSRLTRDGWPGGPRPGLHVRPS